MKLMPNIISVMFLLMLSVIGKAQNKYEYGVVTYYALGGPKDFAIYTSISGVYQRVDWGKLADGTVTSNFIPANKVLNDLADKGWEIYNTESEGTNGYYHYFYIRKKKADEPPTSK